MEVNNIILTGEEFAIDMARQTSTYTFSGFYKEYFKHLFEKIKSGEISLDNGEFLSGSVPKTMQDTIKILAFLVNSQCIHRALLKNGKYHHAELSQEEISEIWQGKKTALDDDKLQTAQAMIGELYRTDPQLIHLGRENKNKLVVTCRYVSVLMVSILKANGIPARCRTGFCTIDNRYIDEVKKDKKGDHWIVQFFDDEKWVNLDVNRINNVYDIEDFYDVGSDKYEFVAQSWLRVRENPEFLKEYISGEKTEGWGMLAQALLFDFNALMNNELSYLDYPVILDYIKFDNEEHMKILDKLASLMCNPQKNYAALMEIYKETEEFSKVFTPLTNPDDMKLDSSPKIIDAKTVGNSGNL